MTIRPTRYLLLLVWATAGLVGFVRLQWPVVAETWGHDAIPFVGNLLGLIFIVGLIVVSWLEFLICAYERWFKE